MAANLLYLVLGLMHCLKSYNLRAVFLRPRIAVHVFITGRLDKVGCRILVEKDFYFG